MKLQNIENALDSADWSEINYVLEALHEACKYGDYFAEMGYACRDKDEYNEACASDIFTALNFIDEIAPRIRNAYYRMDSGYSERRADENF